MLIDIEGYITIYFAEGKACLGTFDIYSMIPKIQDCERETEMGSKRDGCSPKLLTVYVDLFRW